MNLIDRDALLKHKTRMWDAVEFHECVLVDDILNAPTVAITYCKDCENYNTKGCASGFGWCEAWDNGRMDNHYCNFGKRKCNDT